jgi:MYXO-CTERM domain-containing protein
MAVPQDLAPGSYEVDVILSAVASEPVQVIVTPPRPPRSGGGGCSHGQGGTFLLVALGMAAVYRLRR